MRTFAIPNETTRSVRITVSTQDSQSCNRGSIPLPSTKAVLMTAFLLSSLEYGGIAQLARAPALQAGGRRFDSDYLHKKRTDFSVCAFFLYTVN